MKLKSECLYNIVYNFQGHVVDASLNKSVMSLCNVLLLTFFLFILKSGFYSFLLNSFPGTLYFLLLQIDIFLIF